MEKNNGTISFLDVEIKINPNGFDTWTWRKPTHAGLFLNFCAVCPKARKEGLVLCLLHRAKAVCSSVKFFKTEVDNLRRLFMKNNYPIHFFNKILERFLHQPDTQTPTENEPDPKILFKVPLAGKISKDFFNNICLIIKRRFGIHVVHLYRTTKVGHYFQLKRQTPSSLRSDVVYKFTCSRDVSTTYIGTSSRHLRLRIKKHLSDSASNKSAVKEHIQNCSSSSSRTKTRSEFIYSNSEMQYSL